AITPQAVRLSIEPLYRFSTSFMALGPGLSPSAEYFLIQDVCQDKNSAISVEIFEVRADTPMPSMYLRHRAQSVNLNCLDGQFGKSERVASQDQYESSSYPKSF